MFLQSLALQNKTRCQKHDNTVSYDHFIDFYTPFMALNTQELDRIARLARLEFTPEQANVLLTQVNSFFNIVETMRAVDTTGVEPMAHPFDIVQQVSLRLMPDQVTEVNNRTANQQTAPSVESGLFLVPKVIE